MRRYTPRRWTAPAGSGIVLALAGVARDAPPLIKAGSEASRAPMSIGGTTMVRAQPPDGTRWWEHVEELTLAEALRHEDPRVRQGAELWQRIGKSALLQHAAEALRRHREWEADPLRVLARLLDTPRAKRWPLAAELARRPGMVPRRWLSPTVRERINPAVHRRVREESARGGRTAALRWLTEDIFPDAVLNVVDIVARGERAPIRLGRAYVGDEQKRRIRWHPWTDWPPDEARRWFLQAIRAEAEKLVLADRDSDVQRLAPPERRSRAVGGTPPLAVQKLLRLLMGRGVKLSKRDRWLLDHVTVAKGNLIWREGTTAADIAALLGTSPGAIRLAKHKLNRKVKNRR